MSSDNFNDSGQWPVVDRRKPGWALDWQTAVERDKAELARILHDDTGGLLVAAIMDITWAEKHFNDDSAAAGARLIRARAALDDAIRLNRKIIEDLRPTLLENFGLVAALKWHFAEICKSSNIHCEPRLPGHVVSCAPAASIGLFRAAETLLSVIVGHQPRVVELELNANDDHVTLEVGGTGLTVPLTRNDSETVTAIASVTARIRALGGELSIKAAPDSARVSCRVPNAQVLTAS